MRHNSLHPSPHASHPPLTKNVPQSVLEVGNSKATIISHCGAFATAGQGKAWFVIMLPHSAANALPRSGLHNLSVATE